MARRGNDPLDSMERLLGALEVANVRSGVPFPLGAHPRGAGVNFAIFSRHATGVRLDFFAAVDDEAPTRSVILDGARHKTGDIWHVWIPGVARGQLYGYRLTGPYEPWAGHRFNPDKLVVDPYAPALALVPGAHFGPAVGYARGDPDEDAVPGEGDDAAIAPKSVVAWSEFDWKGDQPLRRPWEDTVVYELHVRGYTAHPSAAVEAPGTYAGLVEKIPHLLGLGVTAVELMPVQEFNEHAVARTHPGTGRPLVNYWGYDPLSFLAPKSGYARDRAPGAAIDEFKGMVREFHRAGIEVILDVVFNHTVEGNHLGPTVGFRGIDNAVYYWLAEDRRYYRDFTSTGSTVNASHPVVRDLILDALRHWVVEMHVDGFRFDLASVLGRDRDGRVIADAPLLERIAEDPILRDAKLIAEAWDAAGAYQVGAFSHRRWAEWNGKYRDEVRRFWRGDPGMRGAFASRLAGSSDLYGRSGKGPECSINFVTCHDGFTLADLVSYARKHNEANGEANRDGPDENYSANWGAEGPSADPGIEAVRQRQIKNFLLTMAVSRGVPMLLGGDELRRTQGGNNNPWCQDGATSWVDWRLGPANRPVLRFASLALAFRRAHPLLRREAFYRGDDCRWLDPSGAPPRWEDEAARALAFEVFEGDDQVLLLFNAAAEAVRFELPRARAGAWRLAFDTGREAPRDAFEPGREPSLGTATDYRLEARSAVVLVGG